MSKTQYVVHVDVKILGTVVWEMVTGTWINKRKAKQWETKFMKVIKSTDRLADISSMVLPIKDILDPEKLATDVNREVEAYFKQMGVRHG